MNHLVADLYRWSWGRWRVSEVRCQTATAIKSQVFEYWAMSSLATDTGENQSAEQYDNDDIRSDWVGPIGLRLNRLLPQSLINIYWSRFFIYSTIHSFVIV